MLQAPGLDEADSDDDSVVSVEETAEETRQRRLLKKQLQRRDRDKALRREQSRKRVQKEKDMMIQSKLAAEAEAARRVARWGPIMMADAAKVAPLARTVLPFSSHFVVIIYTLLRWGAFLIREGTFAEFALRCLQVVAGSIKP